MTACPPLICIVGPTASGKSAVAEEIALRIGGAVVSVDAMQVYTGMDIGTAKTPLVERRCALHMIDVCPITENYSVERFQSDARACIDRLRPEGTEPVLCGGTGLYLNAVIDEMDFASGYRGDDRREAYEGLARSEGPQAVYDLLMTRDPKSAAAIHPNNVRRVIRALELADEGKNYAASLTTLHDRATHYDARIFGLMLPREQLYRRIDARVDEMFNHGLVAEVERRFGDVVYSENDEELAAVCHRLLIEQKATLSCAESCTGGLLSSAFIDLGGSSAYFVEGDVTYANEAKMGSLGVKAETLEKYTAVSRECAQEMAAGMRRKAGTDYALATTGYAGPDGEQVGLVYVSLASKDGVEVKELHLTGERSRIRRLAVLHALDLLRRKLCAK